MKIYNITEVTSDSDASIKKYVDQEIHNKANKIIDEVKNAPDVIKDYITKQLALMCKNEK